MMDMFVGTFYVNYWDVYHSSIPVVINGNRWTMPRVRINTVLHAWVATRIQCQYTYNLLLPLYSRSTSLTLLLLTFKRQQHISVF